jgi:hypothetical protein
MSGSLSTQKYSKAFGNGRYGRFTPKEFLAILEADDISQYLTAEGVLF